MTLRVRSTSIVFAAQSKSNVEAHPLASDERREGLELSTGRHEPPAPVSEDHRDRVKRGDGVVPIPM